MKNIKLREAVLETVRYSVPVKKQQFAFSNDEPSDQYIIDGPTFRSLLKKANIKYNKVKKREF